MAATNGIRVYTQLVDKAAHDVELFYSRRGNGPIYRWSYEAAKQHWRVLRMHLSDFATHELCLASWKSVPDQLQAQLNQHYVE